MTLFTDFRDRVKNAVRIYTEPPRGRSRQGDNFEPGSPEFHQMMDDYGLTSHTHDMSEEEARDRFDTIVQSDLTDSEKYKLLYALDVDVMNNTARGMACPVINDILAAQGEIVMKGYK
jgi:hypothetical protein